MDLVKVILLGAPAVGKTSIIQQFVWNDFSEEYLSTEEKHTYYPSVIINDHLYELKISDLPAIPYFPVNSFYEWTEFRFYGLRSATAYVLVFDLTNTDTFQYIRNLREQISESRDMRSTPLLVVGNKQDLLLSAVSSCSDGEKRRDIVNLVKKHWKCGYVECSARYNWRVVAVFKELMKTIDAMDTVGGPQGKGMTTSLPANRRSCNITRTADWRLFWSNSSSSSSSKSCAKQLHNVPDTIKILQDTVKQKNRAHND